MSRRNRYGRTQIFNQILQAQEAKMWFKPSEAIMPIMNDIDRDQRRTGRD